MSDLKKNAIEYANERVPEKIKFKEITIIGNYLREEIHDAFIRGFEFSQKWIPVEEKLPKNYENVLLKSPCGSVYVGFYTQTSVYPICRATEKRILNITEWRSFL